MDVLASAADDRRDHVAFLWAACVGAAASACVLFAQGVEPLPALPWAAAFLFLVVEEDVRRMRIPNWLTLPALAAALAWRAVDAGAAGAAAGLVGALVPFAVLFFPFARGWLGAGDVKATMVLGALWGGESVAGVIFWTSLCGGLLAVTLVVASGGGPDLVRRWARSLVLTIGAREPVYCGPAAGSVAASGIPCGIALALGAAALELWGLPWA
jgi:prepilin peptidase CpaA